MNIEKSIQAIDWNIEPINLYRPIAYSLESGGKRIRPLLMKIAFDMFGGEDKGTLENPAIAIEIFHNFTLLHDDLMDNSPTRRNRPAVHKKWNANTAILSGDAMLIKAYDFLLMTPKKYWDEIFPLFNRTALEVCQGQQLDMDFECREDVEEDDYFDMIRQKTAVLLACAMKMGAMLADTSKENKEIIYRLGIDIGMAFQLKDDYLDSYGTFEILGKRIGNDILCHKKTFLLITALRQADERQREILKTTHKNKNITEEKKIEIIMEIYNQLEIDKRCMERIELYYRSAKELLGKISASEKEKLRLMEVIEKLNIREK